MVHHGRDAPDDSSISTWRLTEPGGYEIDFIHANDVPAGGTASQYEGLPLQRRDVSGNKQTYEYSLYGGSATNAPRLDRIYLNGSDASDAKAIVEFTWHSVAKFY